MASYSERIKRLRAEKGLEQTELAQATGISYSAIQKYEVGRNVPSLIFSKKLADFFGVSIEYLRGESDDRNGDGLELHAHRDAKTEGMPLDTALSLVTQLERLAKLHDDGKITDEEYSILKGKIIRG